MFQANGNAEVRDAVATKLFSDEPAAFELVPDDVVKMFAITPEEAANKSPSSMSRSTTSSCTPAASRP